MKSAFFIFLFSLAGLQVQSQIDLDIQTCLQAAVENNLSVQQSINNVSSAQIALVQKKFDFLPFVGASINLSKNFGATVDNFTQQIAQSPTNAKPSLNASLVLFNGLSKWNSLKAAGLDAQAASYSLEDLRNDIRLNTALAFFQVIFNQDQLNISEERHQLLIRQHEKTEALYFAGTLTKGDVYNIAAQVAAEKVNLIQSQNALGQSLTNLIVVLNLDPTEKYNILRPDLEGVMMVKALTSIEEVFAGAKSTDPGLKARKLQIQSSEYKIKVAKASYLPSLRLSYGMGSYFSSNARPVTGFELDSIFGLQTTYGETTPIFSQFSNNFNQGIGLTLDIPIFNNYRIKQSHLQSKLNLSNLLLTYKNESNLLYQNVLVAHQDAEAAYARYLATEEQIEAIAVSFDYAKDRYEAGLSDFFSYLEVLNNKTKAEKDLLASKYDFILKSRVLDLYMGKPLEF